MSDKKNKPSEKRDTDAQKNIKGRNSANESQGQPKPVNVKDTIKPPPPKK